MSLVLSFLLIAFLGMMAIAPAALAQEDDEPTPELELDTTESHLIVGGWIVVDDSGEPTNTPGIAVFHDDGTVVDVEVGFTTAGVWEATGDTTAAATFAGFITFEGVEATAIIRIAAEVDEGDIFTGEYSITVVNSDGSILFTEAGTVTGTRMEVEPVDAVGTTLNGLPTWVVEGADNGSADATAKATEEPTAETTAEPTEEPSVEPTEEPTPAT